MSTIEEQVVLVDKAFINEDTMALKTLLLSQFVKIKTMALCRLYILTGQDCDAVVNALEELKDDNSLSLIIDSSIKKSNSKSIYKFLNFKLYEDITVCLENFIKCIESNAISVEDGLRALKPIQKHLESSQSAENSNESFLCKFIAFKLSPKHKNVEFVKMVVQNRPIIPYCSELWQLYRYLADNGVGVEEFGYEKAMFDDDLPEITIKGDNRMIARAMTTTGYKHEKIVESCGMVGIAEMLQLGQVIDFAEFYK